LYSCADDGRAAAALADALMPYACKSTTFCAKNSRFDGIMMGHEGQFGLLHRASRIEICTKKPMPVR
ncbi:MAG: hypothetical protein ACFNTC_02925, partial [Prevotella sp.]